MVKIQTSAGLTPEPKSFHVSCGVFRRVGQRACFKIHLVHPGGKRGFDDGISGKSAETCCLGGLRAWGQSPGWEGPWSRAPSTSRSPVLLIQLLIHLQLHSEALKQPVVLGEQLLPPLHLLLYPVKATVGEVNSNLGGLTQTLQGRPIPPSSGRVDNSDNCS